MHSGLVFGSGPLTVLAVAIAVSSLCLAAEAVVNVIVGLRAGSVSVNPDVDISLR